MKFAFLVALLCLAAASCLSQDPAPELRTDDGSLVMDVSAAAAADGTDKDVVFKLSSTESHSVRSLDSRITTAQATADAGATGKAYADQQIAQALVTANTTAKTYTDASVSQQSTISQGYTNQQAAMAIANATSTATTKANQAKTEAISSANGYTDTSVAGGVTNAVAQAGTAADTKVAAGVQKAIVNATATATAKADQAKMDAISSANGYTDTAKASAIATSNTYTDTTTATTQNTVENKLASNTTNLESMISAMRTELLAKIVNVNVSVNVNGQNDGLAETRIGTLQTTVASLESEVVDLRNADRAKNCEELAVIFQRNAGSDPASTVSQVYSLYPGGANDSAPTRVYCNFAVSASIPTTPTNLAFGQPTAQSSTRPEGGASSNAVNAQTGGGFSNTGCTHTISPGRQWWYVRLSKSIVLDRVTLQLRTGCCDQERNGPISLHILNYDTDIAPAADGFPLFDTALNIGVCTPGVALTYNGPDNTRNPTITCTADVTGDTLAVLNDKSTVLTLCNVEVFERAPQFDGGFTMIISDPGATTAFTTDMRLFYDVNTPTPSQAGIVGSYMKMDLKAIFTELIVVTASSYHVFQLSDFTGPVILDPATPYVDAADSASSGIIAGQQVFVTGYELSGVCSSGDCRQTVATTDATYSNGLLVVFDGLGVDASGGQTIAYFGGTPKMDTLAQRGVALYAR